MPFLTPVGHSKKICLSYGFLVSTIAMGSKALTIKKKKKKHPFGPVWSGANVRNQQPTSVETADPGGPDSLATLFLTSLATLF